MITIYHNPRCSKSRQTLNIIQEHGIEPTIVLYLETPLNKGELKDIVKKLDIEPRDIIRKGEDAYKAMALSNPTLSHDELLDAIAQVPKLLERPIVVKGDKAILGRPPENVLALL